MLVITTTMAAAAALINMWLAIRCGQVRVRANIMQGDGGNPLMLARMRAQANFVEYTPFVLILVGLIEYAHGPRTWLWIVMAVYLLGRIAHPLGMEKEGTNPFRMGGIIVTMLTLVGLAGYALYLVATAPR